MNTTRLTWIARVGFPWTELSLLLVAVFWGTSYGLTKSALVFTSVFMFLAIRFLLTFLVLLMPTLQDFKSGRNRDWKAALPTGTILLLIFCCEVFGVSQTTATNAAVLISLSAIFTVFVEAWVNKKRVSAVYLGFALVSVVGVALLTLEGSFSVFSNFGDLLILAAALLRALMVTATKYFTEGKKITTLSLTALQSLVVGLGALFVVLARYKMNLTSLLPASVNFWLIICYLVMFCTLFAFFVQNYAVRRLAPSKVSLLMGSEPLFGALFAVVWLGEELTLLQWGGATVILVSVMLVTLKKTEGSA
ncbi:DMT family transporter [Microbulbifer sp. ZKSA006]|uniref:DMT family transporter n=1 Tax=Microbulbifer sp. ZKSA006 TaxID=3243390 RepID=UPI00403A3D2D